MEALEQEIKELIVTSLALEEVAPADIDTHAPLFIEGLGLDSIDALELGLALQKRFGVTMSGDKDEVRARFASVAALAAFVAAHLGAKHEADRNEPSESQAA
ncbi:phosphopantetheine-binding protein [Cupriavidus plantarum]|uniref:phosphopantetheine-binding protein n=1 Tax=Cupriavidus plantarum TaxID=942865 RepID=UPI000E261E45|nr:phosphopantetheine-binding protein [Cupriavidus plantarum]NYH98907.1 acyl carrier protein [Cupriavidus plantarum]REF01832.1 acyl carrier protein [Cupriavidus plantarum]RLK45308.1 acyl carrier protein [Cupriavidus plantarum]